MAYSSYIPAKDADFSNWLLNFYTLINANPTNYGLIAGDATLIGAQNTAFQAAYTIAVNPATRTAATVAAKDNARAAAEAVVRPYAVEISQNSAVSDALKVGVGVTVKKLVPTPIPAPTTAPVLSLVSVTPGVAKIGVRDAAGGVGKAKPFGAAGAQIWRREGAGTPTNPFFWTYVSQWGKSPNIIPVDWAPPGTEVVLRSRYVTQSGPGGVQQVGPWSTELTFHST